MGWDRAGLGLGWALGWAGCLGWVSGGLGCNDVFLSCDGLLTGLGWGARAGVLGMGLGLGWRNGNWFIGKCFRKTDSNKQFLFISFLRVEGLGSQVPFKRAVGRVKKGPP